MARLLVTDDEVALREAITMLLRAAGHVVDAVGSGEDAIAMHGASPYDALVVDITLPGISGIEAVRRIKQTTPEVAAVFITAHSSIPSAVEAMRAGGCDYVPKPFDNDDLLAKVERALADRQAGPGPGAPDRQGDRRTPFVGIVGESPAITEVTQALSKVARTDVAVLLTGESGTGKELAARTLHRHSARSRGPFMAINCGAITPTLAESELFGHERGAFTDARGERVGLFERAQNGTVFLDEVGELPLDMQVKLLRVLQEGEVVRVGGNRVITVNARVVAATNRDLQEEVAAGRFREDLYWRLNVVPVVMPPLRDRREDLPLLIEHFLPLVNAECGSLIRRLTPAAMALVMAHSWPGNIRELINALKRGAVMTDGNEIDAAHLPAALRRQTKPVTTDAPLQDAVADAEQRAIEAALQQTGGSRDRAAEVLGISRRTLFNKLKQARERSKG